MRVIIKKNYEMCSSWTARYIAQSINSFRPSETGQYAAGNVPGAGRVVSGGEGLFQECSDI